MKHFFLFAFILSSLSAFAQPPTLVAHWSFTNGSTTESVHGWTPTSASLGTPSATSGKSGLPGTALKFKSGDNLVFASDARMNLTSWTMTATVRVDSFYSDICQGSMILARDNDYTPQHYALSLFDNWVDNSCYNYYPDSQVFVAVPAGIDPAPIGDWSGNVSQSPRIKIGQWYCIMGSYDGAAGTLDLFVDGVLVVSEHGPAPHNWPNQYNYTTPTNLFIGSSFDPAGMYPYWFNGAIDDIKIYSGSLNSLRISDSSWFAAQCGALDSTTGVAELNVVRSLAVTPNPATNSITVVTPPEVTAAHLAIFNMMGAMVQQGDIARSGKTIIDISELPAGVYLVNAESEGRRFSAKFVKE